MWDFYLENIKVLAMICFEGIGKQLCAGGLAFRHARLKAWLQLNCICRISLYVVVPMFLAECFWAPALRDSPTSALADCPGHGMP